MRTAGILLAVLALGCSAGRAEEPVVGGPCEGCEAVFQGLPRTLSATSRIAPEGEPGDPLVIEGTVTGPDGAPRLGIVVYAYHTDAGGIYPRPQDAPGAAARRHGRLRGWAVTDGTGRYRFDTIRPAGYPGTSIPQHVHFHVLEPGRCTYWIDSLLFDDDPRLDAETRRRETHGRGGEGIASPTRDEGGAWHARRDIRLGAGIPDYEDCDRR